MLAFIHVASRRVFVSPCTRKPDAAWVEQQGAAFVQHLEQPSHDPKDTILFRDRDGKYTPPFDEVLRAAGIEVRRTPVRSPNMNAFIERRGQSLRVECLDRMLALGETHLNFLVGEYVAHHNTERPHQSLGNRPLPDAGEAEPDVLPCPERGIVCHKVTVRRSDATVARYSNLFPAAPLTPVRHLFCLSRVGGYTDIRDEAFGRRRSPTSYPHGAVERARTVRMCRHVPDAHPVGAVRTESDMPSPRRLG